MANTAWMVSRSGSQMGMRLSATSGSSGWRKQNVILESEKTINTLVKLIVGRMETYKTGMVSAKQYKEALEVLNGQVADWSKLAQKYAVPPRQLFGPLPRQFFPGHS